MENKRDIHKHSTFSSKKRLVAIIATALFLVLAILWLFFLMQPQRTVANFCHVAKEEKPVLTGDANYQQQLISYQKLEAVPPDATQPDITTIIPENSKYASSTIMTAFGTEAAIFAMSLALISIPVGLFGLHTTISLADLANTSSSGNVKLGWR